MMAKRSRKKPYANQNPARKKSILQPWDFVPANADTRDTNFAAGAGDYSGHGIRAKIGKVRSSTMLRPPKDITEGFSKPLTLS